MTTATQLVILPRDSCNPQRVNLRNPGHARCFAASDNRKPKNVPADQNLKWKTLLPVVLTLLLCGPSVHAQSKLPKIGWLSAVSAPPRGREEVIRRLRELGHVDGKTVAYEFRYADNKFERLPALADELVGLKVDLLIAPGTAGALALKKATKTIPIVFLDVTDPVAAGLVDSLAHPGGNVTGFSSVESLLAGKRLELLKETVTKLSSAAALWDPRNPSSKLEWQDSQAAARELGLKLHSLEVSSDDKYESTWRRQQSGYRRGQRVVDATSRCPSRTAHAVSRKIPPAGDLCSRKLCYRRRVDVLRRQSKRTFQAHRRFHRQDSAGRQTRRPPSRATDQI